MFHFPLFINNNITVIPICLYFFADESPRYLFVVGQKDKAIKIMNKMGCLNNKNFEPITNEEIAALDNW